MLDKLDYEKIDRIYKDYFYVHQTFTKTGSKTYDSFVELMKSSVKDGSLTRMYKELIALGISCVVYCEPCIAWHIKEAMRNGAKEEQIMEAMDVALEMGGGPMAARSGFAFKVLEYLKSSEKNEEIKQVGVQ